MLASSVLAPWVVVAAVVFGTSSPKPEIVAPPAPIFIEPTTVMYDHARELQISVTWANGVHVVSPQWSGTVTAIADDVAGRVLESGDRIIAIDGVWRIAAYTPTPFYRTLGSGAKGADVRNLNELLSDLDYPSGAGDEWTPQTESGVLSLSTDLGAGPARVFDPAWAVWLPRSHFTPISVEATVGAHAPAPSDVVLKGPAVAIAATALSAEGLTSVARTGDWRIEIDGIDHEYSGDPSSPLLDVAQAFSNTIPTDDPIIATLKLARPLSGLQVPPSALVASSAGGWCLVSAPGPRSDRSEWTTAKVEVVGGELGASVIAMPVEGQPFVVANPGEIGYEAKCR